MSDALTDTARDERRAEAFGKYLKAVEDYLLKPNGKNLNLIIKAAEKTDSIKRGYFGSQTSLGQDIKERMEKLKNNDKQEWAKFLSSIIDRSYCFSEFKKLSPFKDKLVLHAHYGYGWGPDIKGDVQKLVTRIIAKKKNWKTHDCDYYLVIMDMPSVESADAIWLDCGILGIKGPRKNKSK